MDEPDQPAAPRPIGIERIFLLALLVLISLAFAMTIGPFFGVILWGMVIAIIFQPVYARIHKRMPGHSSGAAFLTLLVVILAVVIPTLLLGSAFASEASKFYNQVRSGALNIETTSLPAWLQNQIAGLDLETVRPRIEEIVKGSLKFIVSHAVSVGQGAFGFFLALGVMLYLTFFLLRDGVGLSHQIRDVIPLAKERKALLADKFLAVVRATIKGTLVVAILQGTVGGLIFWALGIPGALLWGVLMGMFSLVPAFGTGFVWLPVAIYLLLSGDIVRGVILMLAGTFIISLIDNVVRPILVGRDTQMPDYLVLISTLGGLQVFGLSGILIGPLLAALFIAIWTIVAEVNKEDMAEASSA